MPRKLRKSRSRSNNNRPASKQSRRRKTPLRVTGNPKSVKRSRRRVKRGGVSTLDVLLDEVITDLIDSKEAKDVKHYYKII